MEEVQLKLNDQGHGEFFIPEGNEHIAFMQVGVSGQVLTAFHTEVRPQAEGQGLAKKLLSAMVDYARKNGLKVNPLCPYVYAQFKRHPEEYADVWLKPVV
ncbi:MAG TPA: GNAT family N-acetyltransferase [Puia sp.]|jgi:predicted GNAT family acetyltransferase|nr:GNAT family N-acetyltransferase [Puia sp.]